jgi:hypothetical protein
MYIVAIAWLYVALLLAATQPSLFTGVASFLFYGLLPMSIALWISGSKVRRQRARHKELLANQRARHDDGSDSQANQ